MTKSLTQQLEELQLAHTVEIEDSYYAYLGEMLANGDGWDDSLEKYTELLLTNMLSDGNFATGYSPSGIERAWEREALVGLLKEARRSTAASRLAKRAAHAHENRK